MASINFLYRSTKDEALLTLRLLYRYNGEDYVVGVRTKEKVSKTYWKKQHNSKTRDASIQNKIATIKKDLSKLSKYVIDKFENSNPEIISKNWLTRIVDLYYNPKVAKRDYPLNLVSFIDLYIDKRRNEVTKSSIVKFNVIKHKMERLEKHIGREVFITDINEEFKTDFEDFYNEHNYSQNTMHRELGIIKTFCKYAKSLGIETHPQMDTLKFKKEKVDKIYLNENEIEAIKSLKDRELTEYLINAKDWLIISCFTGQRISDFMRFTSEMVREENGKKLIEFTQKKTSKDMAVPLHPEVLEILEKRKWSFPRSISDQRYNDYIKEVCKLAKIDEVITGKKQVNISKFDEIQIRSVSGNYPKYELVTSHIGRRSFATNFYGKIPTNYLIYVTGHSSETMFLNYIGKSNKDLAMEITNYF